MSKQGWTYKKLGEVASYINGFAFKPEQWSTSGTPIVRIQNLNNGDAPYNFYEGEIPKKFHIQKGDLLISWSASLGAYFWSGERAYLNQHIFKVVFDKSDISRAYLRYAVISKLASMSKLTHGSTMRHIVKKDFDNTKIPVPPLAEQEAIVAELDEINEAIVALQQQVDDLDTLAQSTFYDMFGDPVTNPKAWPTKKLGEIATVKTGPFGSMLHKEDYISNGIPLVNPIHMIDFKVVPNIDFTISQEKANELTNYLLEENDVIFARRGDIGRCAVIDESQKGFLCGTGSLFARFNIELSSKFILFSVRAKSFTSFLISNAKGATMLNLNSKIVSELKFILPPLSLQQEFATKVEAIEVAKASINAQISEMQDLLSSRMSFYFD